MIFSNLNEKIGARIVRYLDEPIEGYTPFFAPPIEVLAKALRPADVLLIEGNSRIASIIKYLTQSTWSHSAIYVGEGVFPPDPVTGEPRVLIEALAYEGVIASPLSKYAKFNTRICRPVGLTAAERRKVVDFVVSYLGRQYDLRYIIDLIRFLVPYPPVPVSMRRKMLAFGHGDPTRAICSTMIAAAFHSIGYPILPDTELHASGSQEPYEVSAYVQAEAMSLRRDGLFTPRDFDISPFFQVIKPTTQSGFDFHAWPAAKRQSFDLTWALKSLGLGAKAGSPVQAPLEIASEPVAADGEKGQS
ncbi:MAG TPA: YiiX/YebB-like N1pC/P60 family cysteine hydrolase [Caulobacteraceae bacterium]|nr:YiiX/YebB-like N1pC/P60 family cysteine hydrolase [Caulobacteraceae bacterium]